MKNISRLHANPQTLTKHPKVSEQFVESCADTLCTWNLKELKKYSRTSMARTLMACLPRLIQTHSLVPWKKPIAVDLG